MRYIPNIHDLMYNQNNYNRLYGEITWQATTIIYSGLLIYRHYAAGQESAKAILEEFTGGGGELKFNELIGSFRVQILEADGKKTVFGDNSGCKLFYYDEKDKIYSESFLTLLDGKDGKNINPIAVSQFLLYGSVYEDQTICECAKRTSPNYYYIFYNDAVQIIDKQLMDFDELKYFPDLHSIIQRYTQATEGWNMESVITGGTDSRTILSHLVNLNTPISLSISGSPDHVDVKIAKQIAKTLQLPLLISDMDISDKSWLNQSFIASDGVHGTVSRHRP